MAIVWDPRGVSSSDLRRIGAALATFWAAGDGPTRSQILAALGIAGYSIDKGGTKQDLVRSSVNAADDDTARLVVEELLSLLREVGEIVEDVPSQPVNRLRRVAEASGFELTADGFMLWGEGLDTFTNQIGFEADLTRVHDVSTCLC